ncbi:hypothetical protein KY284_000620 [Solanum tuberosum]|nr:hypothetical protein KY284_000620 [Solanum tuberosum]
MGSVNLEDILNIVQRRRIEAAIQSSTTCKSDGIRQQTWMKEESENVWKTNLGANGGSTTTGALQLGGIEEMMKMAIRKPKLMESDELGEIQGKCP